MELDGRASDKVGPTLCKQDGDIFSLSKPHVKISNNSGLQKRDKNSAFWAGSTSPFSCRLLSFYIPAVCLLRRAGVWWWLRATMLRHTANIAVFIYLLPWPVCIDHLTALTHSPEVSTCNKCSLAPLCYNSRFTRFLFLQAAGNYLHQVFTDVGVTPDRCSDGLGTGGADRRWDVMHIRLSSPLWSDRCASVCATKGRFISPADSDLGVVFVWICLFLLLHLAPRFSAQSLTRPLLSHMVNWIPPEAITTHFEFCQIILSQRNM